MPQCTSLFTKLTKCNPSETLALFDLAKKFCTGAVVVLAVRVQHGTSDALAIAKKRLGAACRLLPRTVPARLLQNLVCRGRKGGTSAACVLHSQRNTVQRLCDVTDEWNASVLRFLK